MPGVVLSPWPVLGPRVFVASPGGVPRRRTLGQSCHLAWLDVAPRRVARPQTSEWMPAGQVIACHLPNRLSAGGGQRSGLHPGASSGAAPEQGGGRRPSGDHSQSTRHRSRRKVDPAMPRRDLGSSSAPRRRIGIDPLDDGKASKPQPIFHTKGFETLVPRPSAVVISPGSSSSAIRQRPRQR